MIDEFSFIGSLKKKYGMHGTNVIQGIGDDAAVVQISKNTFQVFTCDSQISGVHFPPNTLTPEQIGEKAALVTLSDISAMGATPQYLLVSLHITEGMSSKYIDALYKGIYKICKKEKIVIIGGNITKSKTFAIDLFMTGKVSVEEVLFRKGAKPGDKILVIGTLGDAAAGLYLLQHPRVLVKQRKTLVEKFLLPQNNLSLGKMIAKMHFANSMIDVSDGLSSDVLHICNASNTGVKIFEESLPISEEVFVFCKKIKRNPLWFALNGGEDYGLCFTVSKNDVTSIIEKVSSITKERITVIGEVLSSQGGRMLVKKNGETLPLMPQGWNHFSS